MLPTAEPPTLGYHVSHPIDPFGRRLLVFWSVARVLGIVTVISLWLATFSSLLTDSAGRGNPISAYLWSFTFMIAVAFVISYSLATPTRQLVRHVFANLFSSCILVFLVAFVVGIPFGLFAAHVGCPVLVVFLLSSIYTYLLVSTLRPFAHPSATFFLP